MTKFTNRNLLYQILIALSLTTQSQGQVDDAFKTLFGGTWKHTQLYCRIVENGQFKSQTLATLVPPNETFMPNVEISFKEEMINQNDGTMAPARNVEKAITQGSCLLPKPEISAINVNDSASTNSHYIWSKNKVQLVKTQSINGIQYFSLTGKLVDKKIDYKSISNCGNQVQTAFGTWSGIIPALLTYYRYEIGKSYYQVEANRNYTVSVVNNTLNLEFFDSDICAGPNERVVMQFTKKM